MLRCSKNIYDIRNNPPPVAVPVGRDARQGCWGRVAGMNAEREPHAHREDGNDDSLHTYTLGCVG